MSEKWIRKQLVDIGPISKGAGISRSQSNSGDIPAVRYGEIYTHHDEYVKSYVSHISSDVARTSLLTKKGDILFAGSGETPDEIGKCVAVIDDGVYAGGDIVVFSPPQGADPIYWGCLLNLPYVQRQKAMRAQGSSIYHLRPDATGTIVVEYTDDDKVQHHIAEILLTCDEVIEKSERTKEKLRRIKDGLLADLMTRGIGNDGKIRPRPSKAPHLYKQSELGLIPKEWDVKRLGDVCEEPQYGLNAAAVEYDGAHGYIRITDIDDDTHQFMHEGITSPAEFSDSYILKEGDIVLSRTGASVGKSYVYDSKDGLLYFAGFLIRFRCHSDVNHRYVFSQLLTKRYWNWVSAVSMRTGQPGINAEEYSTYRIVVPQKKDEQDQIADRLAAVDARIESEENAIAKYRKIKAGLMHRLLTPPSGAEIVDLAEGAT